MVGKKRTASDSEDVPTSPNTRSSKIPKVDKKTPTKSKPTKKGVLAPSKFKESARPLHLHITHSPPSAGEKPEDGSAAEAAVATDAGHVASISIQPTDFSTGSYGWKGNRRVNVELTNPETGQKETVAVMININATVVGSKSAKEPKADEAEAEEKEETHEQPPQATHDTAPPKEK